MPGRPSTCPGAPGDRSGEVGSLAYGGFVQQLTGDPAAARGSLQRALELNQAIGDWYMDGWILTRLAEAHRLSGNLAAAADCARRAIEQFEDIGCIGRLLPLGQLGQAQQHAGDYRQPKPATSKPCGCSHRAEIAGTEILASILANLSATFHLVTGSTAQARGYYGRALAIVRESHLPMPDQEARALGGLGRCHLRDGNPELGRTFSSKAWRSPQHHGLPGPSRYGRIWAASPTVASTRRRSGFNPGSPGRRAASRLSRRIDRRDTGSCGLSV